jgi:peptidoglycan hydrolase-like protein with peptidoglycan-binding domain
MMKNLIFATASVLALSVAGAGIVHAADTGTPGARTQTPSATMPSQQGQAGTPVNLSESQIRQVQQKLKTAGLYDGQIDGRMGPDLKEAISAFQELNRLPQTGAIDQQTMAALNSSSSSGSSSPGTGAVPGAGGVNNPNSPATR